MKRLVAAFILIQAVIASFQLVCGSAPLSAAERVTLTAGNWDEYVPEGKEVDSIYGDIVLRNDKIEAVIGRPVAGRNANMTVRNVGGAVIDLTKRNSSNDQLSAYFPAAGAYAFRELPADEGKAMAATLRDDSVTFSCQAEATENKPAVKLTYELKDGAPFLHLTTVYSNPHDQDIKFELLDSVRADRSFDFGTEKATGIFWAHDNWWRQAFGLLAEDAAISFVGETLKRKRPILKYVVKEDGVLTLKPNESISTGN